MVIFLNASRRGTHLLALISLLLTTQSPNQQAVAQRQEVTNGFQGRWEWMTYSRNNNDQPPFYRKRNIRVPERFLGITLYQRRNRLSGRIDSAERFLAKVEDVRFITALQGNVMRVRLESGHGGTIAAVVTLRGGRLYWRITRAEGEHYFPSEAILRRVRERSVFDKSSN